jgi:hypothetical protein
MLSLFWAASVLEVFFQAGFETKIFTKNHVTKETLVTRTSHSTEVLADHYPYAESVLYGTFFHVK